jgi:hypothetical protein
LGLGTIHLNVKAEVTPQQHADLFFSTIIEGPSKWKVRPVAEVFYEDNIGEAQTISGLAGAIWQVRDNLAFDAAFRRAFNRWAAGKRNSRRRHVWLQHRHL